MYVNTELFIAVQELSSEGIKVYATLRIPAVVNTVTLNGPLEVWKPVERIFVVSRSGIGERGERLKLF